MAHAELDHLGHPARMTPSRFKKLTHRYGRYTYDASSGLPVYHVSSPHALVQAAGYLKFVLAREAPCTVLYRGQTHLHPTLRPSLYRGVATEQAKNRCDKALTEYLADVEREKKVLRGIREDVREPLLQHYGIRTRWIDLVDNVWIALWFACHSAQATGPLKAFLHFERRTPRGRKSEYAYVLLVRSAVISTPADRPGVTLGTDTEIVDLRVAAPSVFLRPHAQHALLLRRRRGLDHKHVDYGEFVVGTIRARLEDALGWLGEGRMLTIHALFPPPTYDFGYRDLLKGAPPGSPQTGSVHLVGA